ncbi:ribonuclease H-like domain-containing protein [Tanacetum coccineum]|uniref:Ribonuclease H-like domain-containing protein n=1 Tax=Tanacetum coccineum TaxID=301880 RepID=A0ABQ4ZXC5_9ASTR
MFEARQTTIPFPSRLNDYYCEEKKGSYGPQFSEAYSYGASHIDNSIPRKEKDPRSFTLPCYINNVCFDNALADLGASSPDLERPFLSTAHAKIDVFKRKITLRVRDKKNIFKSMKPASSLIKRGLHVRKFYNCIIKDKVEYKGKNAVGAFMNVPIFVRNFSVVTHFVVVENIDGYRDQDMGDIILGEPFFKASCVEARRFYGLINIHNGSANVTYQMVRSHPRFKNLNAKCNKIKPLLKDLAAKKSTKFVSIIWNPVCVVVMLFILVYVLLYATYHSTGSSDTDQIVSLVGPTGDPWDQRVRSQLIGKDLVSGLLVYELPLSSLRKKYRLSLKNDMPPRDKCFEIIGFPQGFKRNFNFNFGKQSFNANVDVKMNDKSSSSSQSSGFTADQMQKLLSMINDKPSGSIHANMAGRTSFFNENVWFNINFSKHFYANYSLSMTTITMGWIINYGTNQHLTVLTVGMYNIVDISEIKIIVGHPNGTLATVSHVRNFKLTNVIFYDVLVGPEYCVSLLSVNKLIRDSKMFVGFDENKCQSSVVMSFHVSKLLWHNRLGHPVDQVWKTQVMLITYNFFDSQFPQSPNDDGKDYSVEDGSLPHYDGHDSTQCRSQNDRLTATQVDDQNWSEGSLQNSVPSTSQSNLTQINDDVQTPTLRRSDRQSKLPVRLTDYVSGSNVKYGIEKYVSYSRLNNVNICFATSLNKSIKPSCLSEVVSDPNWDLGILKYFLEIEIIENDLGFRMSQRKYCLELLHEYGMVAARPVVIPIPENSVLSFDETSDDKFLSDFTSYQNQHMHSLLQSHFKAALRVLRYLKDWDKCPKTRRIQKHVFCFLCCLDMIAANPIFHERTKHFELDVHFVREKVLAGIIKTMKVSSDLQTADMFTKCLGIVQHKLCCKNLGMLDVFASELVGKDSGRKRHVSKKESRTSA